MKVKKESCDFCGRESELFPFGEARICFLCKKNQNKKPKGKEVKNITEKIIFVDPTEQKDL